MVQTAVRTEPARRLESYYSQARLRPESLSRVRVFVADEEIPRRFEMHANDVLVVPDFTLGERLIERGADSARIAVLNDETDGHWLEALGDLPPGEPVVPAAPHRLPLRMLVILPTYNERQNLARMVARVRRYLDADVLIVDDNSPDGTGLIADELAGAHSSVHVLHRPGKAGLGRAYLAGFAWGLERGYDRLFEMDCDFSHAPWDLPRLAWASQNADLVIGSRYVPGGRTAGWALSRRMLSRGANLYTKLLLGFSVKDWTAGFRCYAGPLLAALDLEAITADGYAFQIEMTWRAKRQGGVIRELPIRFIDREAGKSKMSRAIALEAVRMVPRLWLRR